MITISKKAILIIFLLATHCEYSLADLFVGYFPSDGKIKTYNTDTWSLQNQFYAKSDRSTITFGPDGLLYLYNSSYKTMNGYNVNTGSIENTFYVESMGSKYEFGNDGYMYTFDGSDGKFKAYNPANGSIENEFYARKETSSPGDFLFSPSGLLYATFPSEGNIVKAYNTTNWQIETSFYINDINGLEFSQDGYLYSWTSGFSNTLRKINSNTGSIEETIFLQNISNNFKINKTNYLYSSNPGNFTLSQYNLTDGSLIHSEYFGLNYATAYTVISNTVPIPNSIALFLTSILSL